MEMDAVGDQLDGGFRLIGGRTDDTGGAMGKGRHGVIEVCDMAGTGFETGGGLVVISRRMGDCDSRLFAGLFDERQGTGQFRCDTDDFDHAVCLFVQALEKIIIRGAQVIGLLRTFFGGIKERAFHRNAADHRGFFRFRVAQLYRGGERGADLTFRQGHRGWRKGRDAVFRQVAGDRQQPLILAIRKIVAGIAMEMDVDQSRDNLFTFQVDGLASGGT